MRRQTETAGDLRRQVIGVEPRRVEHAYVAQLFKLARAQRLFAILVLGERPDQRPDTRRQNVHAGVVPRQTDRKVCLAEQIQKLRRVALEGYVGTARDSLLQVLKMLSRHVRPGEYAQLAAPGEPRLRVQDTGDQLVSHTPAAGAHQ